MKNASAFLALSGATADGEKDLLMNINARGLQYDPLLAVGDGALEFWKALDQVFPNTRTQRWIVQKTANLLAKVPKSPTIHTEIVAGKILLEHGIWK